MTTYGPDMPLFFDVVTNILWQRLVAVVPDRQLDILEDHLVG